MPRSSWPQRQTAGAVGSIPSRPLGHLNLSYHESPGLNVSAPGSTGLGDPGIRQSRDGALHSRFQATARKPIHPIAPGGVWPISPAMALQDRVCLMNPLPYLPPLRDSETLPYRRPCPTGHAWTQPAFTATHRCPNWARGVRIPHAATDPSRCRQIDGQEWCNKRALGASLPR